MANLYLGEKALGASIAHVANGNSLHLPQKVTTEVVHTLSSPGIYTWTAPDANNNNLPYKISLQMWGGGAGGAAGGNPSDARGGGGGGGGSYVFSNVTVYPDVIYKFYVGASGTGGDGYTWTSGTSSWPVANRGTDGGNSYLVDDDGTVITAGGGKRATVDPASANSARIGGLGGVVTITQSAKCSDTVYLNGGAGGKGGAGLYSNGDGYPTAGVGGSVPSLYGQPGGSGGQFGHNPFTNQGRVVGGGGGASAQTGGGKGGDALYQGGGNTGGGGGAGYTAPANAVQNEPQIPAGTVRNKPGGNGGIGRITFLFNTSNGGSEGTPPEL